MNTLTTPRPPVAPLSSFCLPIRTEQQNPRKPQFLLEHRGQPNPRYTARQACRNENSGRNKDSQVCGRLSADPRPPGHQRGEISRAVVVVFVGTVALLSFL